MAPVRFSVSEARQIVLHAQGLDRPKPFGEGTQGVLNAIARLGYVQIDTISVIERAHHHVLWSRVPRYRPEILNELQSKTRQIFEYWSHAASYLPIGDYRYCLPRMRAYSSGRQNHWFARDRKTMSAVLKRIRDEGPLQAKDFEAPTGKKAGPWFEWKPAKKALEQLYIQGELMITGRRGFQKIYDLTERVLPAGIDTRMPTAGEMARYLIRQQLRSNGLALEPEMRYLRKNAKKTVNLALNEMLEEGEILECQVGGTDRYFIFKNALSSKTPKADLESVKILSPFDNLVIQRRRLKRFFEFDYQIECYVPAPKRKHGYFVLPVLWGDRFVARIDVKADRVAKTLKVLSMVTEGSNGSPEFLARFTDELDRFAAFNGCTRVEILSSKK